MPYEPGTLKAVAYQKDRKLGEYVLSTAKSVTKLKVCRVTENERNIAYIKIWLVDDNGTINSQEAEKRLLHASVVGNGVLEGFGTANPSSEEDYFSDSVTTIMTSFDFLSRKNALSMSSFMIKINKNPT